MAMSKEISLDPKTILADLKYNNSKALELFGIQAKFLNEQQSILLDRYIYDSKNPVWKRLIFNNRPSKYIISNTGIVKNTQTNTVLEEKMNHKGYLYVSLTEVSTYNNQLIHRLVAQTFIPNPENKPQVNHITGMKTCNWVGNLEWNTCEENIHHALKNGLFYISVGERANAAQYTNTQIHEVCRLLEKGLLNTEISKLTGVDVFVISKIKCKNCWTQISDLYNIPKPIKNATGSAAAASKYKDEQIHKVCELIKDGYKNTEISRVTGVTQDMISRIKHGKNWHEIASKYGIVKASK